MPAPAFLKARQTKYAAYATMYIVVVFAIITVANVLANRYNKSYDSTSNKRYSLSDQTAKIVKEIEAACDDHLLRPVHAISRRRKISSISTRTCRRKSTSITSISTRSRNSRAKPESRITARRSCRSAQRKKKRRVSPKRELPALSFAI